MIHNEYHWKSIDGLMLYGQSWMPDNQPDTVINYIHGFKDHSNRIQEWAIKFVDAGYGVIAIDLRGHGRSEGRRGYAKNFDSFINDVAVLRQQAKDLYPGAFHILYGHSLGGNLAVNYLVSRPLMPDAAIIASPWFGLAVKPSWIKTALAQVARYLLPGIVVKSTIDVQYLSRNDAVVQAYIHDPFVHNLIRPKLFIEIEHHGITASGSIYKINIPLLVMHGTDDHITSLKMTKNFVRNAGYRTTFKEWPGGYHELHNDLDREKVFEFLVSWIKANNRKS